MSDLKSIVKSMIPFRIWKWLKEKYNNYQFLNQLRLVSGNHRKALDKVQKKTKITVAFFVIHESVWKYEELYRLMEKDSRFYPLVVICPYTVYGEESMLREMRQTYKNFKHANYNVIKSLNEESGTWLNVKKEIQPDMVFFTNPWSLTRSEYLIENYNKILTCYVPYGFKNSYLHDAHYNKPMQNLVWKFFIETEIHKKLSLQYSRNKSVNVVVTGYPGMDKFLKKNYQPIDVWKIKDKKLKRIIWAPHHTIPGMGAKLDFSTFLKYAEFIFDIAHRFQEQLQIAFKPHPILRAKLSKDEVWGKVKTDLYYQKWAELTNGQLHEGEYIDLFLTSDGMIHDSSSFVVEYLYTNKPVMFLVNDDSIADRFNEIGKMALSKIYQGSNENDIEIFLNDVIMQNRDTMENERILFFNSIIKPPHNLTASENIFNYVKSEIFGDKS